jgi:hypothetical protein
MLSCVYNEPDLGEPIVKIFYSAIMCAAAHILILGVSLMQAAPSAANNFPAFDALPESAPLPDPLRMMDGTPVTSAAMWHEQRRPELLALIQHYMYGFAPEVEGVEVSEDAPETIVLNGTARLKQLAIRVKGLPDNAPRIHLAVFVPREGEGPFPVFLGINRIGNHAVAADEALIWNKEAFYPDPHERGQRADFWCVDYLIRRGYAFATFLESDIDPDRDDFTDGIHPFYPNLPWARDNQWGTIRAWAWGFHRCVDYLVTDADIDPKRIAVIGHSRRGKTALLAAALDERVALAVPHQSGTGGCALSRDKDQETVERINRVFPHWFNDAFLAFGDNEDKLPFDQHCLVALVAPRALLDTEGAKDHWANPPGALRALEAAKPVWELLGADFGEAPLLATCNEAISPGNAGPLLQLRLDHRHELNRDFWEGILNYADIVLASK